MISWMLIAVVTTALGGAGEFQIRNEVIIQEKFPTYESCWAAGNAIDVMVNANHKGMAVVKSLQVDYACQKIGI